MIDKNILKDKEYPHYFIDRNHIWQPRLETYEVPSDPQNLVIEVCGDLSDSKNDFILNELHAMIFVTQRMKFHNISLKNLLSMLKTQFGVVYMSMETGTQL